MEDATEREKEREKGRERKTERERKRNREPTEGSFAFLSFSLPLPLCRQAALAGLPSRPGSASSRPGLSWWTAPTEEQAKIRWDRQQKSDAVFHKSGQKRRTAADTAATAAQTYVPRRLSGAARHCGGSAIGAAGKVRPRARVSFSLHY